MGQYYKALIERKGKVSLYDVGYCKMTEQCWQNNVTLGRVAAMLLKEPARVAWIGDHSEGLPAAMRKPDGKHVAYNIAWGESAWEPKRLKTEPLDLHGLFLASHDKREYMDCGSVIDSSLDAELYSRYLHVDESAFHYHPLPLITAVGNGLGLCDYRGKSMDAVGRWAWDLISVERTPPQGYWEIRPVYQEASREDGDWRQFLEIAYL